MSYAGRAEAVVAVEWVFFLFPVILLGIVVIIKFKDFIIAFDSTDDGVRTTAIIYTVVISIGVLIGLLLNLLLTNGVMKGHSTSLKIWCIANIVLILLHVLYSALSLIATMSEPTSVLALVINIIIICAVLLYKIWSINVVVEFRKELLTASSYRELCVDGGVVYSFPTTPNP